MRRLLIISGIIIISVILVITVFLIFISVSAWKPEKKEIIFVSGEKLPALTKKNFVIFSWNIGYAGLGREMDFFYEGGNKVRPPEKDFRRYFEGIKNFIKENDSADFFFLQEIDKYSKRSYYTDETIETSKALSGFNGYFAKNYDSRFVPVPLTSPMGRVNGGIEVLTPLIPDSVIRIDYGTKFSWPTNLFMLQRCMIFMRYRLENGKDLVLINTHNSAFDTKGTLRQQEQKIIFNIMKSESEKGNYVVAGGDWNSNPPVSDLSWLKSPEGEKMKEVTRVKGNADFPGFRIVFDPLHPTNRDVDRFYKKGETSTTIIDYFIVSPGIKVEKIKTIPLGFENSDHNPVILKFSID